MTKKILFNAIFLFLFLVSQHPPVYAAFSEDWTGSLPSVPEPFADHPTSINWDITIHSRDGADGSWGSGRDYSIMPDPWNAEHHTDCAPPPNVHTIQQYKDTAFVCKEHLMTSIFGAGAAELILTPNHLLDLSQGEAVIQYRVSTLRTAGRDYWQVNITPPNDHQQLPQGSIVADLHSPPRNSIMIGLKILNSTGGSYRAPGQIDAAQINANYTSMPINLIWDNTHSDWMNYDTFLTPSATRRDLFEIRMTNSHIKLCMPEYSKCFIDTNLPANFPSNTALVQFSHHSYNPDKECNGSPLCLPNTHHWDEFYLSPTVPFTIIKAAQRHFQVNAGQSFKIIFPQPAQAGSKLRFVSLSQPNSVQVSYNNGTTWTSATKQPQSAYTDNAFNSYFTGDSGSSGYVPTGTTEVLVRGQGTWRGNFIVLQDPSLWSYQATQTPPSMPPTASVTPTPTPLLGDVDRNRVVNILDYQILANTFGSSIDLRADVDKNGMVNILDYQILANNFGR